MSSKLDVRDLRISFWTNNGSVRAVRGISFQVEAGETLAIVGESGSGKSVTARAMMGILAPNAIVEGGEIFFDGMDLMKIPEDMFHLIRGNKVSMIFQDPLSSLNPIVRVGRQLTEAILANNRTGRKHAAKDYDILYKALEEAMRQSSGNNAGKSSQMLRELDLIIKLGNKEEIQYRWVKDACETVLGQLEEARVLLIGGSVKRLKTILKELQTYLPKLHNPYLFRQPEQINAGLKQIKAAQNQLRKAEGEQGVRSSLKNEIEKLKQAVTAALAQPEPDFLALGYHLHKNGKQTELVGQGQSSLRSTLEREFLSELYGYMAAAVQFANQRSKSAKEQAVLKLESCQAQLESNFSAELVAATTTELTPLVEASINPLSLNKDSFAYTFASSLKYANRIYKLANRFVGKEQSRAKKRAFRKERLPQDIELGALQQNIQLIIKRTHDSFVRQIAQVEQVQEAKAAQAILERLVALSSKKSYKLSLHLAQTRAIEVMNEVGIPEARRRFKQYPFEFSGGMRQRVVIAIALSSNPDVLICDEPTTALDVTIQAQILDLINELKEKRNLSVIFITHDLGVVANVADKIAVMYAGKVVEYGLAEELFYEPAHPYTWALLASMPDLDTKEKLESIPGTPPDMIFPPQGDAFALRNQHALQIDFEEEPPLFALSPTHYAATWLLHPDAPKVEPPLIVTERIKRMTGFEFGKVPLTTALKGDDGNGK